MSQHFFPLSPEHNEKRSVDNEDMLCNEECHRMDANKAMSRTIDIVLDIPSSISSKSSVESNSSDGKNSVQSHRSGHSSQKRILQIKDTHCWDCHKVGVDYSCTTCLRSYHKKCSSLKRSLVAQSPDSGRSDPCPECLDTMRAEEESNPSACMQWLNGNVNALSELLEYTIMTVKAADRNHWFSKQVSDKDYPDYRQLIVNPMDLSLIEDNIKNKTYGSTNSFLADIKWIYHNCLVFNTGHNNALISDVKNILRVAKQECEEIEICPDCYRNYYSLEEDKYFSAVCRRPHAIVWAKLKGHPYWPAKVVRYNAVKDEVDVRFFGTHDKCWLKPDKCHLMSQNYPNTKKPSKFDQNKFDEAIHDMNSHLDELQREHPGLFMFHDKHIGFTAEHLYLSRTQKCCESDSEDRAVCSKKVLNTYNGISFKSLKVKTSKFDISDHWVDAEHEFESPNRAVKRNTSNDSPKCFSKSITVRQEINSSLESEPSPTETETRHSIASNHSFDRKSNSNDFDENDLSKCQEMETISDSQMKSKSSPKKPKLLSVSGKTPKVLTNKSFDFDIASNNSITKPSKISSIPSNSKPSDNSNTESLRTKVKTLEFKLRKSEEQYIEANVERNSLKEELKDMKKTIAEMENSINEIKRKQWCTHCLKEAILPCCWNTCYCTVECQHEHWPVHSKTCRRRQQIRS